MRYRDGYCPLSGEPININGLTPAKTSPRNQNFLRYQILLQINLSSSSSLNSWLKICLQICVNLQIIGQKSECKSGQNEAVLGSDHEREDDICLELEV